MLTAREMRKHFTACPKRPGNAAKPGDVVLPPFKAIKLLRPRKPKPAAVAKIEAHRASVGLRLGSIMAGLPKIKYSEAVATLAPVHVAKPQPWRGPLLKPGERKAR